MFELHTSDFDPCPARAMLRRDGKFDGVAGIALTRGLIAHESLALMHHEPEEMIRPIIVKATHLVINELEEQGRTPSDAVMSGLDDIEMDIMTVLDTYKRNILPITQKWTLLGTEVPVYWELDDDIHLSSHLDALFVDESGKPIVWDWKWRKDALAISDLSRNLQLACYFSCLTNGMVELDQHSWDMASSKHGWEEEVDGWGYPPSGSPTPDVAWVDLPSLKPYTRKTTTTDDEGKEKTYMKGDDRPISRVIRNVKHHPDQVETIRAYAIQRARLIINEIPMYIPQGCSHCECESWCPRFDMSESS